MRLSNSHLYIEPMSRAGIASAQQSLPEELQTLCAACSDTLTAAEGDRLWRTGWLVYTSGKKPEIVGLLRLSGPPDTTHTVELSGRFRADTPSSQMAEAVRCFLKKWLWKQATAVYVQTSPELLGVPEDLLDRMGFARQESGDSWECERPAGNFPLVFALLGCMAGVYISTHFGVSILAAFLGTAVGYAAGIPFEKQDRAKHVK